VAIQIIKTFSATKAKDREALGDKVTDWLERQKGAVAITDKVVTQSSDQEFHCLTITLFCVRRSRN
jgi:hypothetical protein